MPLHITPQQAVVQHYLTLIETAAGSARRGLALAALNAELAQTPKLVTNPNEPDPRQQAQQQAMMFSQQVNAELNNLVSFTQALMAATDSSAKADPDRGRKQRLGLAGTDNGTPTPSNGTPN